MTGNELAAWIASHPEAVALAIVALSKRVPAMNPRRASIAATVGFGAFVVSLVWALVPGGFH